MKRWLAAIALLIVVAGIAFYFSLASHGPHLATHSDAPETQPPLPTLDNHPEPSSPAPPAPAASIPEERLTIFPLPKNARIETITTSPPAEVDSPATPKLAPTVVLEIMRSAIRDYGSMFGGNPVGNNAEITRALNGDNPKQTKFIRPDSGLRVNAQEELVDPWGTPLFFHQLSGDETEIRSAGPDKIMWTADDLVIK